MQISFCEEFPTKDNLNKLKLVTWKTKLYMAARSVKDFESIKKKVNAKCIYWPILKTSEGYWISPFSKRFALKRIFNELKNKKIQVMLDLELPTTRNPLLLFNPNFFRNKRLIKNFIKNYNGQIYLAENHFVGRFKKALGLHYSKTKVIKMLYHSMMPISDKMFRRLIKSTKDKNHIPAFGVIARGVLKVEPLLSAKQLDYDLQMAKQLKVKEIIIFRLGGLNKKYLRVIKKYV